MAKPIYIQAPMIEPEGHAILLAVHGEDPATMTGTVHIPDWHELPAAWDGPHPITLALSLADSYADAYGFYVVLIDIAGSQLWQSAWGDLLPNSLNV